MGVTIDGRVVELFAITPRTRDPGAYWKNILDCIDWSDRHGLSGVLLFTGNDVYVEPWLVAQTVMSRSARLSPLVAVNPLYQHPFSAARMISSLTYLYGRRTYVNWVAGTAISYQEALGDRLGHQARYDRLLEYAQVMQSLLKGAGVTNHHGTYYEVTNTQLLPKIPAGLEPVFFLAGQSESAVHVAQTLEAVQMRMLPPQLEAGLSPGVRGLHLGLITREQEEEAWQAARLHFPADPTGRVMLEYSMKNTDAVWKQRLKQLADLAPADQRPGYWLEPFRSFRADCPYFVGSHQQTATLLRALAHQGVDMLILDIPADEREFAEIHHTLKLAQSSPNH